MSLISPSRAPRFAGVFALVALVFSQAGSLRSAPCDPGSGITAHHESAGHDCCTDSPTPAGCALHALAACGGVTTLPATGFSVLDVATASDAVPATATIRPATPDDNAIFHPPRS